MRWIVLTATLLLVGFAAFAARADAADLVDVVRCHEIAFSRAAENRDAETFRLFLDRDARFIGSKVARGPDDIAAAWQAFFTDGGPSIMWRPKFTEVHEDGTLALTRGPYRMRSKNADGDVVERWGTFNSVWRRDAAGDWRIVFDAGSSSGEPPDEQTQALLDAEVDCE